MFSLISSIKTLSVRTNVSSALRTLHVTSSLEAARKGTREKARKKKVKVEVKKVGFIPHNQRDKNKLKIIRADRHVDDSWKAIPLDNVYVGKYYRWRVYSVEEAIECHRETHHPTMFNVPDAPLVAEIELNTQAEKANRFVDNFQRMATIPYKFDHGEDRKILVFTKENELIAEARNAGASLVGGIELIKDITNGELLLSDYQYVIAHPNILPELVSLRGLMKRKFPNPKSGTLGADLTDMIKNYSAAKDEHQQNFGLIKATIGHLNMDSKHLEANLKSLLEDINSVRPKREGKFITRVLLKSFPSGEQLKIDPFVYIPEEASKKTSSKSVQTEEPLKVESVN
uniref:Large ribosomal subunit protein uL1m n=1 Tax=Megaselia scalaris TaxID=36166 RepID=T1GK75_MEGSC